MRTCLAAVLVCSLALILGCSSGTGGKELFETAQFEEKQHNTEHAIQLYEEVVRKFPGSDVATKAAARLDELKKGAPLPDK